MGEVCKLYLSVLKKKNEGEKVSILLPANRIQILA